MYKTLLRFSLLAVLLLFAFTACNKHKKGKKGSEEPPNVTTTAVKQEDVPIYIDVIGQVIPPVTVYIRPQVAGKLLNVYIQQGAIVNEGDLLYEIDSRPYQAALDEALAQLKHDQALLEYAEQAVKRYKQVLDEDFISILNYEQYESNAGAAKAQVELDKAAIWAAQINLDFCKVVAPIAGKISYYNVDVGNIVAVDDPNQLTVIRPFSPIDVEFSLPQQQFEMIRAVQGNAGTWKYQASLPEKPEKIFEGTTYFIDNQVDQNTGTILLKGRLKNNERELWPGEFVRAKVLYRVASGAFVVPLSSVLIGKDGAYVYLVDKDGKAIAINVTVLTRTDTYAALESPNLHAGDTVIVDGQINVAPGIIVNAVTTNQK